MPNSRLYSGNGRAAVGPRRGILSMHPEDVRSQPLRILSLEQREAYFRDGYVVIHDLVDEVALLELRSVTGGFIERSATEERSGTAFDLAPGHSANQPRIRRIKRPDDRAAPYWDYAKGILADVAADLVGPDVVFHHSKLNFKWNDGNDEVQWHQDIQFYPHTNYSSLTIGTYLYDAGPDDGPLSVILGSHEGELYELYNDKGQWTGCLSDGDIAQLPQHEAVSLQAKAGAITIHNCRTVHSSPASVAPGGRPLLLNSYTSADALAYMPHPDPSSHAYTVVRGKPARWARHDPRPCLLPPDWSGGYSSIFAAQAGEGAM
jgi:ectoine hydroxylase